MKPQKKKKNKVKNNFTTNKHSRLSRIELMFCSATKKLSTMKLTGAG
jgi:hypothetical protein